MNVTVDDQHSLRMRRCNCVLVLITSALMAPVAMAETPAGIAGVWRGVFKGQPVDVKPDGSYPETETRFELKLKTEGGHLKGTLKVWLNPTLASLIKETECDVIGCSFEVVDNIYNEVFTWRVEPHGNGLRGNRNSGKTVPGIGIGTGARLFDVQAHRARDTSKHD